MITFRIDGVDEAVRRLSRVEDARMFVRPMNQSVLLLVDTLKVYPPRLPGQKYVRTGKLGQAWTMRVEGTPLVVRGTVGNNVRSGRRNLPYAAWVQSRQFQARIHQGRWGTDMDAIEQRRAEIIRLFRQALEARARA